MLSLQKQISLRQLLVVHLMQPLQPLLQSFLKVAAYLS